MTVAQSEGELLTIGSVLALLKSEFPDSDLSISKIRFLESAGIVVPVRTPSGYRKFSPADVDRLRYTLRMQKEHYLPLRVIRDHLERMDAGLEVPPVAEPQVTATAVRPSADSDDAQLSLPRLAQPDDSVVLTLGELADEAGLSIQHVVELNKMGVITRAAGSGEFGMDALRIARIAADLIKVGLEPKHMNAMVQSAKRQVDLLDSLLTPRLQAGQDDKSKIADEAGDIANLILRLQSIVISAGIARTFD